jgi:Uma2 family endonuclease
MKTAQTAIAKGHRRARPAEPGTPISSTPTGQEATMGKSAMTHEPETYMTRADYRTWAEQHSGGRFERHQSIVVAMPLERAGHSLRKAAVRDELLRGVRAVGLPCQVYPDGMTIEVGGSDYEPDAVLRCGPRPPNDAIASPDPLMVVKVLSPRTSAIDRSHKLQEYFRVPSLRHYLIVWPDIQRVMHHRVTPGDALATEVCTEDEIRLDPPGIAISLVVL